MSDQTDDEEDPPTATILRGTAEWHDGAGWYYMDDEYPDEGTCGAFETEEQARAHAIEAGYVPHEPITNTHQDG